MPRWFIVDSPQKSQNKYRKSGSKHLKRLKQTTKKSPTMQPSPTKRKHPEIPSEDTTSNATKAYSMVPRFVKARIKRAFDTETKTKQSQLLIVYEKNGKTHRLTTKINPVKVLWTTVQGKTYDYNGFTLGDERRDVVYTHDLLDPYGEEASHVPSYMQIKKDSWSNVRIYCNHKPEDVKLRKWTTEDEKDTLVHQLSEFVLSYKYSLY
jgi:hypothetical protein